MNTINTHCMHGYSEALGSCAICHHDDGQCDYGSCQRRIGVSALALRGESRFLCPVHKRTVLSLEGMTGLHVCVQLADAKAQVIADYKTKVTAWNKLITTPYSADTRAWRALEKSYYTACTIMGASVDKMVKLSLMNH